MELQVRMPSATLRAPLPHLPNTIAKAEELGAGHAHACVPDLRRGTFTTELRNRRVAGGTGQTLKDGKTRSRAASLPNPRMSVGTSTAWTDGDGEAKVREALDESSQVPLQQWQQHRQGDGSHRPPCSQEVALRSGRWVKLICGASFEDVVHVRNLSLIYTLAGVDCIDCAADEAVVAAVSEGMQAAADVADALVNCSPLATQLPPLHPPWLMVSVSDDEDPHFRKAAFDPHLCPPDCSRPCQPVCPADAIAFHDTKAGVISEKCYGCGRCVHVCPFSLICTESHVRRADDILRLLSLPSVDAIEIHTLPGHLESFRATWKKLSPAIPGLKLVAVSVPDLGSDMQKVTKEMYSIMEPNLTGVNLWQLDGRPMSGDIGAGATRATVQLAKKFLSLPERPPGFVQLAGGTNSHTADAMRAAGLLHVDTGAKRMSPGENIESSASIAGVAYGGYARKIISRLYPKTADESETAFKIEDHPALLLDALEAARELVAPLKQKSSI